MKAHPRLQQQITPCCRAGGWSSSRLHCLRVLRQLRMEIKLLTWGIDHVQPAQPIASCLAEPLLRSAKIQAQRWDLCCGTWRVGIAGVMPHGGLRHGPMRCRRPGTTPVTLYCKGRWCVRQWGHSESAGSGASGWEWYSCWDAGELHPLKQPDQAFGR